MVTPTRLNVTLYVNCLFSYLWTWANIYTKIPLSPSTKLHGVPVLNIAVSRSSVYCLANFIRLLLLITWYCLIEYLPLIQRFESREVSSASDAFRLFSYKPINIGARVWKHIYTELFISPSGISDLDCATTKTDTAERSISIGRESLKVFFCTRGLGVLPGSTARG